MPGQRIARLGIRIRAPTYTWSPRQVIERVVRALGPIGFGATPKRRERGILDISQTTAPKSDQQNFDDYLSGPKTVTIGEVRAGNAEQPVELHLVEFPGRPYKPGKSMRRVLVACWGAEASAYVGRRMRLYGDPDVKFGGQTVGGIRIEALSHLEKPVAVSLTVTRGRRAPFTVHPLPVDPADDWIAAFNEATTVAQLQAAWDGAKTAGVTTDQRVITAKDKRKQELA